LVSSTAPSLRWLNEKLTVATLVYDKDIREYRIYIHGAFVLIEYDKDRWGEYKIPIKVKYVSVEKFPTQLNENDTFVKEVIEKYDEDMKKWADTTRFVR
jgi:hypothetical protein